MQTLLITPLVQDLCSMYMFSLELPYLA